MTGATCGVEGNKHYCRDILITVNANILMITHSQ
jgi:hypothetical protein